MELGNFLGKLKGSEHEKPKKFLALILTDEVVQASVWHVSGVQTEIVAIGTPVEWDGDTGTTSELITAVDATISSAVEGLEVEPNEVILGIPHSWTDKHGVLGVKREFISKIRKDLELEAIGYVIITDSVLSYLKMQEGTPTTSVLIQVSRDELTLVLVRLGHIEAVETIGRSDDVVEDVIEGITRFKVADNLPSRIILFNSMHDLSDIIQNLLSVDWPSEFNFLHIPKIEALPKDVAIRALSVAGGSEVAKSLGIALSTDQKDNVDVIAPSGSDLEGRAQPAETKAGRSDPKGDYEPDQELLSAEEIGFTSPVVGVDPSLSSQSKKEKIDFIDPDDESEENGNTAKPMRTPFVLPKLRLPKITLPKLKINFRSASPLWWYLGGGLITLGLLVFWFVWVLPGAIVNVVVTPKTLEENVELTLSSTDSSINFADRIVPATIESVEEIGEKVIETTGKKIVGEEAVGEVTIYNRTSASKTFNKGTQIAFGALKFTLDKDLLVASKSAGSDYVDVPGKASVGVTASVIGDASNLPAGTEFTILSFGKDSYVGKNDTALSGGTSEEIQVVGIDDQKSLVKDLTEELLLAIQNKSSATSSQGTGVYLVPDSAKLDNVTYSAKVGEAAKNLTAKLTLKASLLKYQTDDVTTLVNSSIDQAVPVGYVRSSLPSTVDLSASSVDEAGSSVKGKAKVQVSLLPVVSSTALQNSIKGKKINALENILKMSIPGYLKAEVIITPSWIPTKLKSIPLNPDKINIQIKPSL